jgi:hypothetical protein
VHSRLEIGRKWADVQALVPARATKLEAAAAKQVARNALKLEWAEQAAAAMAAIDALHGQIMQVGASAPCNCIVIPTPLFSSLSSSA